MAKRNTTIDAAQAVEEYINRADWRINANANTDYTNAGLVNNLAGKPIANYWLDVIYNDLEGDAHRNGDYHIHDLDCLTGYCAGWSLRALLDEGFNGVRGRVESRAPKHFREALGQMANFLGILQSEWAGAQAFSSFDTYLAPYVFKDQLSFVEVKKAIRQFVYNLNVPARWGQSPFTNVTIDWTVPTDLAKQIPTSEQKHLFIDMNSREMLSELKNRNKNIEQLVDATYGDFYPEMQIIDRAFYEVLTEGDAVGNPFTFPIPTVNITEDFDWNGPNTDVLFENTAKVGSSYFQNFIGSQYKRDESGNLVPNDEAYKPGHVRSMCPMTPDTELFVRSSKGVTVLTIGELVKYLESRDTDYEVWTSTGWNKCKPVRTPATEVYKVTLSNGTSVKLGRDHLQPTLNGTLSAHQLQVGMKLPFNSDVIDGTSNKGNFDFGFVVGAYLGDGSKDNNGISYSLAAAIKDDETEAVIRKVFSDTLGYTVTTTIVDNLRTVRVGGNSFSTIERFVNGTTALDKGLAKLVYNMDAEFRMGLFAGLCATDGSRSKRRISTSSTTMVSDLYKLSATLGQKCLLSFTDNREGRLGTNPNFVMSYPNRKSYGEYFSSDDTFTYYTITNIEQIEYKGDSLYCIEVDNDDHLFTLANGLVTHNCRLQLDLRELLKRGGGLFGSAEMTGSIGVVTLNMARLGYLYKGDEASLFKRLNELLLMAKSTLEKKRVFVQEMYDRGLYPYTKRYLPHFRNHFSTIGVNGINEMIRNYTNDAYDITSPEGEAFAITVLEYIRSKMIEFQEETGNLYNLEATPAEGTTYRFAKEDKKRYPDILQAGFGENIYYTNSSQIPASYTNNAFEALNLQDNLQCKYTGGTVLHLYMNERLKSADTCKALVKSVISNYKLPYITITPVFSVCPKHGYLNGEHDFCPKCDEELIAKYTPKCSNDC